MTPQSIKDVPSRLKLPVVGWVRMREGFSEALKRATVSCEAGRGVVIQIDTNDIHQVRQSQPLVGVDLGASALATLSTGEVVEGPKGAHCSVEAVAPSQQGVGPQAPRLG